MWSSRAAVCKPGFFLLVRVLSPLFPEQLMDLHKGDQPAFFGDLEDPAGVGKPSGCQPFSPASAAICLRDLRSRSVADFSWPQAAMISSPRGVRIGLA